MHFPQSFSWLQPLQTPHLLERYPNAPSPFCLAKLPGFLTLLFWSDSTGLSGSEGDPTSAKTKKDIQVTCFFPKTMQRGNTDYHLSSTFSNGWGGNASSFMQRQGTKSGDVIGHQGSRLPKDHSCCTAHMLDTWAARSAELLTQRREMLQLQERIQKIGIYYWQCESCGIKCC